MHAKAVQQTLMMLSVLLLAIVCGSNVAAQPQANAAGYDKGLFAPPMSPSELALVRTLPGRTANDAMKDKQFRKLLKTVVPNCEYHYGRDMPLLDALDLVLKGSTEPITIVGDRYVMISGAKGPYLGGRGFLWFDLQDGIALGGFFFQPTNGEPTPALSVYSRQVTELAVRTEQLPIAFMQDLAQWSQAYHVPPVTAVAPAGSTHTRLSWQSPVTWQRSPTPCLQPARPRPNPKPRTSRQADASDAARIIGAL